MKNNISSIYNALLAGADAMSDELTAIRRDLHTHPELGWMEMRTSSLIARRLKEYGCDEILIGDQVCDPGSRMGLPSQEELAEHYKLALSQGADPEFLPYTRGGMTGVIGILRCGDGPVIALRFDIDALPITECEEPEHYPKKCGFLSINKGVMHACGHDGHTTVGLGTARLLCQLRREYPDAFHGTIKFIFQPAEEGVRGAKAVVAAGHLDHVDYLLGAHMGGDASITEGSIGIGDGASLATTKFDVIYHGKAAHAGARPDEGNNAMLAMATAVLNLHAIPRHGLAATRINVGKVTAGSGRNIICDTAKMELEVRGMTSEANEYMEQYALRIIKSAAQMHGCTCEIRLMGAAVCGKNDPPLCGRLAEVCQKNLHLPVIQLPDTEERVSEDYSCMSERVQSHGGRSCYFYNLSALAAPIHNEHFDFQESALTTGVKAFTGIVLDLMNR